MQRALRIRRPTGLDLHAVHLLRLEEDIARAVDQNANAELVDRWHLDRTRLGHLDAGKSTGSCCQRETSRHLQCISSIEIGHGMPPSVLIDCVSATDARSWITEPFNQRVNAITIRCQAQRNINQWLERAINPMLSNSTSR